MFKIMNNKEMELLGHLVSRPNEKMYCREIAKNTKISIGSASQGLRKLSDLGIIKKEKRGKETYYSADTENPLLKHFKIFLSLLLLNEMIMKLKKMSKKIILFGSTARGEDKADSDIDIFILANQKEKVKDIINKSRSKFEKRISPIIVNSNEFITLKNKDIALYRKINEGVTLWSEKDEQ